MKKCKFLALLSVLMIAAILLSSCSGGKKISKIASFEKVMNPEQSYEDDPVADSLTLVNQLDGKCTIEAQSSEFVLFKKAIGDVSYKVFSFRAGAVIKTFEDTDTVKYTITLFDEPIFVAYRNDDGPKYTAYDATGAELMTSTYEYTPPTRFADLVRYGDTLYRIDEEKTGKLTKEFAIPEYLLLDGEILYSESYFYATESKSIMVYDRDFAFITAWQAPSAASAVSFCPLNNGNVLVQYLMPLDPYGEKYDFHQSVEGVTTKYDLVTKLISVENGKVSDVDMDYLVEYVLTADAIEDLVEEEVLAEQVENIAVLYPIVDHQVDTSDAAKDIVLMDNKGKIQKSAKIVEAQKAELPELIGDDLYLVNTLYGRALTNGKGKVLHTIHNESMTVVGDYIVGDRAIYDLSMKKVYGLPSNDASVLTVMNDTIFVIKGQDPAREYEVIAFCDGEQKTICTYDHEDEDTKVFITIENADCYAIFDKATSEYTYYNAAGKKLLTTTALLTAISAEGQDSVLMFGTIGSLTGFYVLTK